ncbi:MAG: L,D-transpeptidase family protein, partial [Alphaproteobacteria bacterium]
PGRGNALGDMRYTLEAYHHKGSGSNDYGIYMHGTPEMALFKENRRAFSSGCIRLQEPHKLAEWILDSHPDWSDNKLPEAIAKHKTQVIKLNNDIPVYITYLTAWADPKGVAYFGDDPYHRDAALKKRMNLRD